MCTELEFVCVSKDGGNLSFTEFLLGAGFSGNLTSGLSPQRDGPRGNSLLLHPRKPGQSRVPLRTREACLGTCGATRRGCFS